MTQPGFYGSCHVRLFLPQPKNLLGCEVADKNAGLQGGLVADLIIEIGSLGPQLVDPQTLICAIGSINSHPIISI